MPLDVARLRDSDLAANETPEACWAAVLLWAAAWHQVPAGSMPDNDNWIAKQAGYAQRGRIDPHWKRVREGAMRGWVLCSDGRYHHPVVAEKVREAWASKLMQRWRTECGRIKKHNDRHGTTIPRPTYEQWVSDGRPVGQPLPVPGDKPPSPHGQGGDVPGETDSKGQGERQGQGHLNSVPDGTDGGTPPPPPAPPPVDSPPADPPPRAKTPEDLAKVELWRAAVSVLEQGGCPVAQTRVFMGRLVKVYTLPVVQQAVAAAVMEQPADARSYLMGTCKRIRAESTQPGRERPASAAERRANTLAGLTGRTPGDSHAHHAGVIDVPATVVG